VHFEDNVLQIQWVILEPELRQAGPPLPGRIDRIRVRVRVRVRVSGVLFNRRHVDIDIYPSYSFLLFLLLLLPCLILVVED